MCFFKYLYTHEHDTFMNHESLLLTVYGIFHGLRINFELIYVSYDMLLKKTRRRRILEMHFTWKWSFIWCSVLDGKVCFLLEINWKWMQRENMPSLFLDSSSDYTFNIAAIISVLQRSVTFESYINCRCNNRSYNYSPWCDKNQIDGSGLVPSRLSNCTSLSC